MEKHEYKNTADSLRPHMAERMDESTLIFFAKELTSINKKAYDVKCPEILARRLFPYSNEADPGATSIDYYQFDHVGLAAVVSNYADDIPCVDLTGKLFSAPVRELALSYKFSVKEARSAAMARRPLRAMKALACRKGILRKEHNIAMFGHDETGLPGFLSNPNITLQTAADNGAGSTDWDDKTPDQILADLSAGVETIQDLTEGVENPNTLLLPVKKLAKIKNTRMTGGSDTTVYKFFLDNNPQITEVLAVPELKEPSGGWSAWNSSLPFSETDLMVFYDRNPEKLTMEVASDFEQFAPQVQNLVTKVNCMESFGGVHIHYPLSVLVVEGI